MARTRSKRTPIVYPGENITAAAIPLKDFVWGEADAARTVDILLSGGGSEAAWEYYDKVPELRYVVNYVTNALTMVNLYVGRVTSNPYNPERLDDSHVANKLMASWAGGYDGQSELLARLGLHLMVAGDSVVAGLDQTALKPPFNQWRVYSNHELLSRSGNFFYRNPDGREAPVPDGVKPFRVWRPHPRFWWNADSPVLASSGVLREICLIESHVHATLVSRLVSAGMILLPDEITLPAPEVETDGVQVDPFVKLFTEIASIAIKNRESAAAVVPMALRGPAEAIEKVRRIDFWTAFDEAVPAMREGSLRRLGLGLDIPPEILLGSSQSNSWSMWQSDEATVRMHIQPLMVLIVGALTQGWLRPALEALPLSEKDRADIPNLVVWFDLSNLRVRPNISSEAQAAYDRNEADGNQLRLSSGISPDAAPSKDELGRQILLNLIRTNPNMAGYAINALTAKGIIDLPEACDTCVAVPAVGDQAKPEGTPPPPSVPGDRSADKQVAPPPDQQTGDPNNNEVTPE